MAEPSIKLPELTPQEIQRFWSKVDETPGYGPQGNCWLWTAYRTKDGYGKIAIRLKPVYATRVAYLIAYHDDPFPLLVLHTCDNPPCVNPKHLWKGTRLDNRLDCVKKGRDGSLRGDAHWTRKHPEKLARGDRSGARTHPERLIRGAKHWSRLYPEKVKRGDEHPTRLHPETLNPVHGEQHGGSKLTETAVIEIRAKYAGGGYTQCVLATEYNCCQQTIALIVLHKIWRHI